MPQKENASTPLFLALLRSYISLSPSFWFLANRIPRLAEVRGKIVLFSRFGTAADEREWEAMGGMGIHPEGWRDSVKEGFEVDLPRGEKEGMGWTLGIQDWFVTSQVSFSLSKPSLPPIPPSLPLLSCSLSSALAYPLLADGADSPDYVIWTGTTSTPSSRSPKRPSLSKPSSLPKRLSPHISPSPSARPLLFHSRCLTTSPAASGWGGWGWGSRG